MVAGGAASGINFSGGLSRTTLQPLVFSEKTENSALPLADEFSAL